LTTPLAAPAKGRARLKHEAALLWQLAWPVLVGQVATVGMGVVDVAMTGHASATDLAAVAVGVAVWSIAVVTVSGVMMALNALVAHEVGAGALAKVPHLVRQSLWKALLVGALALLLVNLAVLVFDHLQLQAAVRDKAVAFLHLISLGMPAYAAFRTLYGYSTSINQTKPLMVISLGALAYNIVLNWLFIYGHWGVPKLGALGCALASSSGLWLMLLAMLFWIWRSPAYRATFPFAAWEWPHWPSIRMMLAQGLPIGITYFAEVSAFAAVGLLVARFGEVTLAGHQIALNFSSLVFMVPLSFGIALITLVGQALGDQDPARARFVALTGVAMSLGFGVLSALLILLFQYPIAAAYSSDPAVQQMARHLLLFAALFQLSDATQVSASCAVRGYKVTRAPMLIHLLAFWGVSLPLGCVLGLGWFGWVKPMQATGFWIGLVCGLTLAALLLLRLLLLLSRKRARA
jgi:MATE family multidrug resistance protein